MNARLLPVLNDVPADGMRAHRPRPAAWLERALLSADAVFDRCYGSRFNPLYRSGTIATTLIGIVMVTGVYLLLFYDVTAPYASVSRIESDLWLGSTMRAVHRYASDGCLVAVLVHLLRVLAQGKSWGPQTLAFVSGLLLTGIVLFAGFTGYVMIWDRFGRELAVGGARLLDVLPLFGEPLSRSFDGSAPILSSFFFLNMFMHVALPLFMVFGMYIHTSRLARSVWFPERRLLLALIAAFSLLGAIWRAPLGAAADPFELPTHFIADLFFGAWIPLAEANPVALVSTCALLGLVTLLGPWWWRPREKERARPSKNDEATCEGCGQCTKDCPYEAILMIPRVGSEGSPTVAQVQPELCMSCGVCSASCTRMRIGPPERAGIDQQGAVTAFLKERGDEKKPLVIVACGSNPGAVAGLRDGDIDGRADILALSCVGGVHPFVVQRLLRSYDGVFFLSCPPRNCAFREGPVILRQRLIDVREPTVPGTIDPDRVSLVEASAAEMRGARLSFQRFAARLKDGSPSGGAKEQTSSRALQPALGLAMSVGLLASVAGLSAVPLKTGAPSSELLLSWSLAGQTRELCRELTPSELAAIPKHMQRGGKECRTEPIEFRFWVAVDGETVTEQRLRATGARGDQPLSAHLELPLPAGRHRVQVTFAPAADEDEGSALSLNYDSVVELVDGQRRALFFDKTTQTIRLFP